MKAKKFTYEEHKSHGAELKMLHRKLKSLHGCLTKTYGEASMVAKKSKLALTAITDLQDLLDDLVFRENPELKDHVVAHCYYGDSD
jgi:hypothetical protein